MTTTAPFDTAAIIAWATPALHATVDPWAHDVPTGMRLAARLIDACAEVERLRAALAVAERAAAPTRGTLINALASAGAARVAAQHAADTATLATVTAARMRVVEAKEAESAARAALDAFERADREADPCPGSRGF